MRSWAGRAANHAGLPGVVRDCHYESKERFTRVTVRRTALHTIVHVNGVDVHFNRLTGGIDGLGFELTHHHTERSTAATVARTMAATGATIR